MKIRPAVTGDRARIQEILISTARFTAQEVGWAMDLVGHPEYATHVLEDPDDHVQGYVTFAPTPMTDGVFDLYWIAVDSHRQGQGIGQVLLRFVENEVRRQSGRMLLIETSSKRSYAPTIRFYQRAGYHEISRIKDFYRIEDDKVVFCKHLTSQP